MSAISPVGTPVTLAEFNASLDAVRASVVDPSAGIFGPNSLAWRLYGEAAIVSLAGTAAVVLQTTHPYVAHAVQQHSSYRSDPVGRGLRTLEALFTWIYGDLDQVLEAAREIRSRHNRVGGQLANAVGPYAEGHRYTAADSNALLWVHATLWYMPVRVYELLYGPLLAEEKELYYRQTKTFAKLFGIPDEIVPATWSAFCEYVERMCSSEILSVDRASKTVSKVLFSAPHPWLNVPVEHFHLLVVGILPESVRSAHGWTFTKQEQRTFDQSLKLIRAASRRLPPQVRFLPAYRHAVMRTRRPRLSAVARLYMRAEAAAVRELSQLADPRPGRANRHPERRLALLGLRIPRPASFARSATAATLGGVFEAFNRFLGGKRPRSRSRPLAA